MEELWWVLSTKTGDVDLIWGTRLGLFIRKGYLSGNLEAGMEQLTEREKMAQADTKILR